MGSTKPTLEKGVLLYFSITRDEDVNEDTYNYQIIDDKNVEGDTLAERRIRMMVEGVKLRKLSKAIFFLGDLIKIAKPSLWFIDGKGLLFNYRKQGIFPLVFNRIINIIPINTGGAILQIEGFPERFKCLYYPKSEEKYAGVLRYGASNILYGLYKEKYDNTKRKI